MEITSEQLKERLLAVVERRDTVEQFTTWFIPATWQLPMVSAATEETIRDIQLLLAEYTRGHRTRQDIEKQFRHMISKD